MPHLPNSRHEAFAQARAKGALLDDAYEDAGFAPGYGHASRLAKQAEVAERIAELRVERSELGDADPQAVIGALLRIAKASETLATPAGVKEAASPFSRPAGRTPRWRVSGRSSAGRPAFSVMGIEKQREIRALRVGRTTRRKPIPAIRPPRACHPTAKNCQPTAKKPPSDRQKPPPLFLLPRPAG